MNFFQQHRSFVRHSWISAAVFVGFTLLIHLLVWIAPGNYFDLPWILFVAFHATIFPTDWLTHICGVARFVGSYSGAPVLTFVVMNIVNAAIGAVCWVSLCAFWIRTRPFFTVR